MLETKQIDPLGEYYENISLAYEKMGNDKEALIWLKKYRVLNDSIFKAENVKNVAEIDTKYQTQKKEAQIAQQNLPMFLVPSYRHLCIIKSKQSFIIFKNNHSPNEKEHSKKSSSSLCDDDHRHFFSRDLSC